MHVTTVHAHAHAHARTYVHHVHETEYNDRRYSYALRALRFTFYSYVTGLRGGAGPSKFIEIVSPRSTLYISSGAAAHRYER